MDVKKFYEKRRKTLKHKPEFSLFAFRVYGGRFQLLSQLVKNLIENSIADLLKNCFNSFEEVKSVNENFQTFAHAPIRLSFMI
jgi:hypothetical protein